MAFLVYIRYCLRSAVYFGIMTFWGIASTPLSCVLAVFGRHFETLPLAACSFSRLVGWALGLRVEFECAEHLATQPAVFMLNHQSALDIWLLASSPSARSVMAKKVLWWSPIGPILYFSSCIFVGPGSGQHAVDSSGLNAQGRCGPMRDRCLVCSVPRRKAQLRPHPPTLLPFKKGGFHLAVQSGMPIVPIVCENYSHMYRFGYFEPVPLKARVLPPIPTAGLGAEDVPALTVKVQEQMLEAMRDISRPTPGALPVKPSYYAPL
ncbi:1-acylglycerol-3-phosphate O [Mycena venus]|uniref:1-acylglycerol-3-phosphate O n=1 Tax=Mycena venus TaxID=2733690 RepID=A0A8H6WX19_9AGAR|nr:1-acylglycerol-3-phosphate O [Mycena venus]